MRSAGALGIVCLVAVPALALEIPAEFDVTSGSMQLTFSPAGAANPATISSNVAGTFGLTVVSSDDHIGDSDMVVVDDVNLSNTQTMTTVLIGVSSFAVQPGSVRFLDFDTSAPGHLAGGVANPVGSPYLEATILPMGSIVTTFTTAAWRPSSLTTVTLTPPSSVVASETLTATLAFDYKWEIGITSLEATLTLDIVVSVEGTTHVPEPALGGLAVLGLGGACTWLRQRRR